MGWDETMAEPDVKRVDSTSAPCACNADPFAALPPEERPRGKPPMGNLRRVICPMCRLEYWTNRTADLCPVCEKKIS